MLVSSIRVAAFASILIVTGCAANKPLPPVSPGVLPSIAVVSLLGPGFHLAKHGLTVFEVSRDICPPPFDVDTFIRDVAGYVLNGSGRYRYTPVSYDPGALDGVRSHLRAAVGPYIDQKLSNRQSLEPLRALAQPVGASLLVVFTDVITKPHMNYELWGMGIYKDSFLGMVTATRAIYVNMAITVVDARTLEVLREGVHPVMEDVEETLWISSCSAQTQAHRTQVSAIMDRLLRKQVPEAITKVGLL